MKFDVIEADPPWLYQTWSAAGNAIASRHYPLMTTERLKQLPVGNVADQDCVLFLWATYPLLPEALDVGKAWGFTYKTIGFNWLKRAKRANKWHVGMGHWTRANSEPCLLFTRGTPHRKHADVLSIVSDCPPDDFYYETMTIIEPVMKHSVKPEKIYTAIERLTGSRYLRLFAREKRDGWVSLGNDLTGNDIVDDLDAVIRQEVFV
jgi:N6-adenosine-specific RNA methylase IME4